MSSVLGKWLFLKTLMIKVLPYEISEYMCVTVSCECLFKLKLDPLIARLVKAAL